MGPLAEIQRPSSFHPTALFLVGHRRPRLYRTCILSQSISLFKYPSELSAKPHWGEASGHFDPQIVRTNLLNHAAWGRFLLRSPRIRRLGLDERSAICAPLSSYHGL